MVRWIIEDILSAVSLIGFIIMILLWAAIKENPEWLDTLSTILP